MKRLFALCLALALVLSLCACGNAAASTAASASASAAASEESAAAEEAAAPAEEAAPAAEAAAAAESAAEPAASAEDTYAALYPVADEQITMTLMINLGGFVFQFIDNGDLNTTLAAQIMEQETGVHIEFQSIDQDAYNDKFQLMIASEDYPDMFSQADQLYSGGIDGLVDDGIAIDLNEYKDLMPDLQAFAEENPDFIKSMTSDTGKQVSIYNYVPDTDYCMLYRKDLLDQAGLEVPTTYDELYEVLTAFKNESDIAEPLALGSNGFVGGMTGGAALTGGYDIGAPSEEDLGWTVDDEGNVVCSAVADNMKEYLEMWSQWYAEGLLTTDYINQTSNRSDEITSGQCGACYNMMTCVSDTEREQYGITMVTGPDIVKKDGDIIHIGVNEHPSGKGSGSISVACASEYPEEACKWLNWFFTDKGRESFNYGEKGNTYDENEDGSLYYTDVVMNNDLGVGPGLATSMVIGWAAMPFPRYHERTTMLYTNDEEKEMYDMWTANRDNTHVYFGDLTQEESETFGTVASDLLTYVTATINEFIMGSRSLDEWDSYVDQCYDMGMQDLIDLKQAAYDRYCAR